MTWVVVVRERTAGWYEVGAFLVDAWCLGVKDAYADEMPAEEFDELLAQQLPEAEREAIEPACARRLVEGAAAYAQELGFLPHRDYRKARKVFGSLKTTDCVREFTFGREGRAHFVAGPDDDEARVRRVLAVLDARFGPDGFDFTPALDLDAEDQVDWDAIDALFKFLESPLNPVRTITGYTLSGLVTAAVMVDPVRERGAWWMEFFGGTKPDLPEAGDFRAGEIEAGFAELWADTVMLSEAGDFLPPLPSLEEPDHFQAGAQFCRGFLRVLDVRPGVLATLTGQSVSADALDVLRKYAELTEAGPRDTAGRRAAAPIIAVALAKMWTATTSLRKSPTS